MRQSNPYSISPIAAAVSAALATPAVALAQEEGSSLSIEEIIVTARKREESAQGIPASIQAIPESMLKEMGALSTEDYARFIPSITWRKTSGAGSQQLIFRGVNDGPDSFIATSSAGMYLDETSITSIGDQPDIRMMDIARVEALAGPQGTLFGASAQAGTLRIITNQPDTSQFEASVDATMFTGQMSDTSYSLTGIVNIPLVEDVFAIRIAAQTAEDAGYIDNVFGHTPDAWFGRTASDTLGGHYAWYNDGGDVNVRQSFASGQGPAYQTDGTVYAWPYEMGSDRLEWGTLDNAEVAKDNWNTVEHVAVKIAARWNINDDWTATLTYNMGDNKAAAFNDYNPNVGDLQTVAMTNNRTHEEWDLTSLTIEADLGFAQFVSATSFYDRNFDYSYDGTFYYKYWHIWACEDWGPATGNYTSAYFAWKWDDMVSGRQIYYPAYCIMGPSQSGDVTQQADYIGLIEGPSWQKKTAQEFRLSHQGESFDWLAGLYYEDSEDNWDSVWMKAQDVDYQTTRSLRFMEARYSDPALCAVLYDDPAAVGCGPGTTFPDAEYVFLTTDRTDWQQKAFFGEVTWHINDEWHATVGGRWFETTNDKQYLKYHAGHTKSNGRQEGGIIRFDFAPGSGGDEIVHGEISEFVPKLGLEWDFGEDKMLYASYTEGFRPGGVNRANGRADWSRTFFPQVWEPDKLKSAEIGIKTLLADGRVQLNLTYFDMNWEDFQVEIVDPSFGECVDVNDPGPCMGGASLPWLKVVGNAGDAFSRGVEVQFAWIPAEGWDVGANAQFLEAEIDQDLILDNRGNGFEGPKNEPCPPGTLGVSCGKVLKKGRGLPNVPDLKMSAYVSRSWPVQFVQGGEMVFRADSPLYE